MPEIQAFRGIRYNLGHVGSLSDVVAPPYDVIGPELQDELLQEASVQRRPADPQPHRAGRRRRGQQPLHPGGPVLQELAERGRAVHRGRPGHLRLPPGVHRRRHDLRPPRLHGPACGSRGSARARSSRTKRPCPAPKVDRLMLTVVTQGEPQPDLRPVSRPEQRGPEPARRGHRRQDAAGGHRSPGRGPSPLAGDRRGGRSRRCRP